MQKEAYEHTELELIHFTTEDVVVTSVPEGEEYQGEFPPAPSP